MVVQSASAVSVRCEIASRSYLRVGNVSGCPVSEKSRCAVTVHFNDDGVLTNITLSGKEGFSDLSTTQFNGNTPEEVLQEVVDIISADGFIPIQD